MAVVAAIPAFCEKCNIVFPSGLGISNASIQVSNCSSVCPSCGTNVSIPDGLYSFYQEASSLVSDLRLGDKDIDDLTESLQNSLKRIERKKKGFDQSNNLKKEAKEVTKEIKKKSPKLAKLFCEYFKKNHKLIPVYIGALAAVMSLFRTPPIINNHHHYEDNSVQQTEININQENIDIDTDINIKN